MKCIICRGDIEPHVNAEGVIYWTEGHNAEFMKNFKFLLIIIPSQIIYQKQIVILKNYK